MNRPRQLPLRLSPPLRADVLPAEILALVLEGMAELLLQVYGAESPSPMAPKNTTEAADEQRV